MHEDKPLKPADIAKIFGQSLAWVSKNYRKLGGVKLEGECSSLHGRHYMSVYFVEKKGWWYDFMMKGQRYTQAWFPTKREAQKVEQEKRNELSKPTSTDMEFFTLINHRLDEVKQRLSHDHYMDTVYHARRWVNRWSGLSCNEITSERVTELRDERAKISNHTANKELRYLNSLFIWGIKKQYIRDNPVSRVERMRVEKREIYVPPIEDIEKVFEVATQDQLDYLWCMRDTFARSREINQLKWEDIDFDNKTVTLYTRKKKHGTRTPRVIPLTNKLHQILIVRNERRSNDIDYVFWHRYFSQKLGKSVIGSYGDRKKFMKTLCKKAGVKYFRFHPFRHSGASYLESIGIPISHIQDLLGHENRKTTEGYIHSMSKSKRDVMRFYESSRSNSNL